jgi:hypothetical protein
MSRFLSNGIFQFGGELTTLETGVCVGSQSRTATTKQRLHSLFIADVICDAI